MTPASCHRAAPDRSSSDPVTAADIAEFMACLARLRSPALGADPAERAELLCDKAELLGRIAEQHARTDSAYSRQVHQPTTDARTAADVNPTLTPTTATPTTGPVRCYYATDPAARPHCGLAATVRYGRTALCGSCRQQRSTLGKGQHPTPINTTDPIDLLAWIAQAHHDLHTAERVLHAAVTRARQHRHPWSAIGDTLNISRQGAQQRFGPPTATAEGRTP